MESDAYEQEVEYERLCDSLTGRGSDELALRLHAAHTQIGGGARLIHLHAVAELAANYSDQYYAESDFNEQRYWRLSCRLAGMLHESMDWGGTFEDITQVADETVARMVATLTQDRRLPKPKRLALVSNQIGLANPAIQMVKLADLQHECFHLAGLAQSRLSEAVLNVAEEWLDDAREILRAVVKIREVTGLNDQVVDLHVKLSELGDKIEGAWKRKARKKRGRS